MSDNKQPKQRSQADAELEQEIRKDRKFSLEEAIMRLTGPGMMKGESPVTQTEQTKAEIEAKAKPNVNAWVNQLIEEALGPRNVDWNEHFDRPPSGRKFRYSAKVQRRER